MESRHPERPRKPAHRRELRSSDGPPHPTPVDIIIGLHGGITTALEATPEHLQAAKSQPALSPTEEVRELQQRHSGLRQELAHLLDLNQAHRVFQEEMKEVLERFHLALSRLGSVQQEVERKRNDEARR